MTKTDYYLLSIRYRDLLTNTKKKDRKSPKHDDDDDDVDDVALRHFFLLPFLYLEDLHPHCSKDNLVYLTRTTDHRESAELNTDIKKKKAVLVFAASWLQVLTNQYLLRSLNKQQINVIQRFILFIQSILFGPTHFNEKV